MGREKRIRENPNQDDISTIVQPVNRLKMNSHSDSEPDYKYEDARLATFQPGGGNGRGWPCNDKVEARKVAKAGLYYTGRYTEAKCPWCRVVITNWDYGDQAMAKHRLNAADRDCPFVSGTSNNVPLLRMSSPSPTPVANSSQGDDEPPSTGRPPNYLLERDRLRSFETTPRWPVSYILPADLARSGFFHLKQDDLVKCAFCQNVMGHWAEEDFPDTEHRNLFPNCPFVQGQNVGNVPMDAHSTYNPFVSAASTTTTSRDFFNNVAAQDSVTPMGGVDEAGSHDVTGIRQQQTTNGPEVLRLMNVNGQPKEMGIVPHAAPANPKFVTVEARLTTFVNWPPDLRQQPRELAEAGFFYIGIDDDRVKCFSCDGGLMNWQPDDEPWTEHARWFHKCGFLRMVKGDDFITKCLGEKPPEPVPGLVNFSADRPPVAVGDPAAAEGQLCQMMASPLVGQVVAMGIETSDIRSALKKKLMATGIGFKNARDLSEAARMEGSGASTNKVSSSSSVNGGASAAATTSASGSCDESSHDVVAKSAADEENQFHPEDAREPHEKNLDIDLESENQRLKDQRTCKICFDGEIGVVFLPCGHLICCVKCAPSLRECPFCRQTISGTVKTYMS